MDFATVIVALSDDPECPWREVVERRLDHRRDPDSGSGSGGASSHGKASAIWRAIHSAVGLLVTPKLTRRRRSWCRITMPYSSLNVAVGTTNRSIDAVAERWFLRNVFQLCDGGRRCFAMYLATVDCATVKPSFSSSPWIRGAPQSGFATLISRIRARSSWSIFGRPPRARDRQRQYRRKPARCHRRIVPGWMMAMAFRADGQRR